MYSGTGRIPSSARGGRLGRVAPGRASLLGSRVGRMAPARASLLGSRLGRVAPGRAALLLAAWGATATPVLAQSADRLTGIVAGRVESEQIWSPAVETGRRAGFLVGAFVDVQTPVPALRVRAEGALARRGGLVLSDYRGGALDGEVESDYLAFHLHAKVAAPLGPAHIFVDAGPGVDVLIRSREDAVLAQALVEEHATVMTVGAGAGAGVRVGAYAVEVGGRWVRALTDAYRGTAATVRNQSLEWVVRLARAGR